MNWQPIETAPKDGKPILIIDMTAPRPPTCEEVERETNALTAPSSEQSVNTI